MIAFVALLLLATTCSSSEPGRPSAGSARPSEPSATRFVIDGISVELCGNCVEAARKAGVDLERLTRHALNRVTTLLPDISTRLFVDVDSEGAIPETGIGGYTDPISGVVSISLDITERDVAESLRVWLPAELAHELDHTARIQVGPGYGSTLIDEMVTEGMADAFSLQSFSEIPRIPWDHALTKGQERTVWARARRHLGQNVDHAEWFFGSGELPRWAGYTIGFDIVSGYLQRHPNATAADLVTLSADTILRGSGFDPSTG